MLTERVTVQQVRIYKIYLSSKKFEWHICHLKNLRNFSVINMKCQEFLNALI
jgi:hypothetical protein